MPLPAPDPVFQHPRLVAIYDALDPDRRDLDAYVALVDEFGARSVVDLGCGTGILARILAARGVAVTGVDPASGSLDHARSRPRALRPFGRLVFESRDPAARGWAPWTRAESHRVVALPRPCGDHRRPGAPRVRRRGRPGRPRPPGS